MSKFWKAALVVTVGAAVAAIIENILGNQMPMVFYLGGFLVGWIVKSIDT